MTDRGPDQPGGSEPPTPPTPPPAEPPTPPPAEVPPPTPPPFEPPQTVPVVPQTGVGAPADLGTRFLARLIDHILLGVVVFAIIIPFVIAAAFTDVGTFGGLFGGFGVGSLVSAIVTAAITIGYFTLMESNMGQTVGKMALGIKTEGPDGSKPSFEEALKRNAFYALGIIPWIGGLAELAVIIYIAVTISNSPDRIGGHDTFAGGTRVVKAR